MNRPIKTDIPSPFSQSKPANPFIEMGTEEVEQSISQRFEHIAARYPERIAVKVNSGKRLTYETLNQRANRLARAILACRGEKEEPIALLVSHDDRVIVAMLAALKAGKVCVPIDPAATAAGVRGVLEDTEAKLVVTDDSYLAMVKDSAGGAVSVINIGDVAATDSLGDLNLSISSGAPACILYTSGSTGQPKGVVHTHRTILNEIRRQTVAFHISFNDRLSFIAPYNVIGGVREILLPLLNGATVCSLDIRTEGFAELSNWLNEEQITVSRFVPSVFRTLVGSLEKGEMLSSLRLIFVGGELVRQRDLELFRERFADDSLFVHVLGCTETGIFQHHFISKHTRIEGNDIPVGFEVDDVQVQLLDDAGHEVSPGQIGEIAVRSRFLPLGYWRRPDLTQSRFLPDPNGGDERIYLTGDLGRLLPDGSLVHLGRKDSMVKIRGYRVELGEIEKHILDHVAIREAAVVAHEDRNGEKRLNAYVVLKGNAVASASDLGRFLREKIPDYALPSAFVFLAALPLTPNGKVDRQLLPVPGHRRPELNRPYNAPQNAVQEKLVHIWEDVLDLRPIGLDDNFFELGGHSLLAVKLFAQIEKGFGKHLRPATLSQAPTVEQLARILGPQYRQESWSSLMPIQPSGSRPALFWVHGEFSNALLPSYLGPDQPIFGLEHQGQDGKPALYTRVEAIATHYLEQIQMAQPYGPYFLGGYSFGGTVAFEIAQQLKRRGEQVPCLFILDSGFPGLRESPTSSKVTSHPVSTNSVPLQEEISRHLQSLNGLGPKEKLVYVMARVKGKIVERTPSRLRKTFRKAVCNAHIALGRPIPRRLRSQYILDIYDDHARGTYIPEPYHGPAIYIKTQERSPDHYLQWARLIAGGMAVYEVPGEHMAIRREPYVQLWAGILKFCLAKAQESVSPHQSNREFQEANPEQLHDGATPVPFRTEEQAKKKWPTLRRTLKWVTMSLASHLPARLYTGYDTLFRLYERRGWHITPVNFYQPIPDARELSDDLWSKRSSMVGIAMNDQHQLELLHQFQSAFRDEYDCFQGRSPNSRRFHFGQTSFCSVDAEILYCMIRRFKPKRMIETGCGISTLLTAEAIRKNETEGNPCRFTAIDPYPEPFLRLGVPCVTELLEIKIESVPIERFASLEENDILFIDSSHVARIGGDVNYLYLEVIPRLKPGVIVHCHDIFLPSEYPKDWILKKRLFWNEQYLLHAFLAFNSEFEVLMANSYLHENYSESLHKAFASYRKDDSLPGSFWFRRAV